MSKPRRGFRHWLGEQELPQPLPEDKLLRYYNFLRNAKNPSVRKQAAHKLVMSHVRLGMAAVARWALTYPHRTDDMVSEMLDALVSGVKLISEGALDKHDKPEIAGYLTQTVYGRINKMLRRVRPVKHLADVEIRGEVLKAISRKGAQNDRDLREIIKRSIRTEQERTVIELRFEGYDDTEIGEMMQPPVSKGRVHQIRSAVKRRILEQLA